MDEDVFRSVAAGQKAETPDPVEPFHDGNLKTAAGDDLNMRAGRRRLRGMNCGAQIERHDPEDLQSLGALQDFADDASAFARRLKAVAPQRRHMDQNVGHAIVWDNEAITLRHVEPLDLTRDLDEIESTVRGVAEIGMEFQRMIFAAQRNHPVQRPDGPDLEDQAHVDVPNASTAATAQGFQGMRQTSPV